MLNIGALHDPLNLQNKKIKILSFLEKDIFVINNYESAPFKNKNHAIESLLPYHVFQLLPDDIKFKGSDIEVNLQRELDLMIGNVEKIAKEIIFSDPGFTAQLLLYHEQRYINAIAFQSKPSPKKKRHGADKVNLTLRIPRSRHLYVYGDADNIHILIKKK